MRAGRVSRASAVGVAAAVMVIAAAVWVSSDASAVRADSGRQNPDLTTTCGTDVIVVLDESASIASPVDFTPEVRAAILNFATGLVGTGSRLRLVEFSTNARDVVLPGGTGFQLVTSALHAQVADYLNGAGLPQDPTSFHPSTEAGAQIYTNWEAGLFEATNPGSPATGGVGAPLVVFITDGDSNTDGTTGESIGANLGNNQAGYQAGADAAIEEISALQAAGGHVLSIAVGAASQQQASYDRLANLTEPGTFEQWTGTGTFQVATTDVLRVTFFDGLRNALTGVLNSLCGASVTIKKTDPAGNVISGRPLSLSVSSAPIGRDLQWLVPSSSPTGITPATRTANTDSGGLARFRWIPGSSANPQTWTSLVTMSETLPAGWSAGDASCVINGASAHPTILRPTVVGQVATWGGTGLALGTDDIVACTVVNTRPTQVTIRKVATPADGTDFGFTTTSTGAAAPLPTSFSLDVDSDANLPSTQTFVVSPGTFTVNEVAPAAPWRLAKLSCRMSAQSPRSSARTNLVTRTSTLVLLEGDQVTCTYTNVATLPQIAVAKSANPTSFQAPFGTVTYGVAISNPGTEQLTISSIRDAVKLPRCRKCSRRSRSLPRCPRRDHRCRWRGGGQYLRRRHCQADRA